MTNNNSSAVLNAVIYAVLGILLCIFKGEVLGWLLTAAGVYFIVIGIIALVNKNYTVGAIRLAAGAIIILGGWLFVEIILIICGVFSILRGVMQLMSAVNAQSPTGIIYSVLTLLLGIALIICRWVMLDWFFIIIGVVLIIDGVSALIAALRD